MVKIKNFILNVKAEMLKVSWPSKDELLNSTSVIIVATLLLGTFVGLIDLLYTFMMGIIIR
ncbi:MAG: preprotein translocase subunit SecE [Candidatus Omnitrophota bacterium]|nr:MAG: preprotein translocase subunit SecE [Candidatus Omnitrophota bacterium]